MSFDFKAAMGDGIRRAGSTPTSSIEGLVTNLASGAVSSIPLVGGLASGLVNLVGGSFGGNPRVPFGTERNATAPHRQDGYLDLSNFAEDDGLSYVGWAKQAGVTVEDIEGANRVSRRNSGNSWENVVAWWRNHPETLRQDLAQYLAESGKGSAIEPMTSTARPTGSSGAGTASSFVGSQSTTPNTPNTTGKTNSSTYAMIGGGALVLIVLILVLLKK